MPIIRNEQLSNDNKLAIWEISEPEEELLYLLNPSRNEQNHLATIKAPQRRLHWIAGRLLAAQNLPDSKLIDYTPSGQPYLPSTELHFSIAHSGQRAAITVAKKPTGVDIELISPRIRKISNRFMNSEEHAASANPTDDTLLIYWCAKEAIIKWCADPSLDFRNQIRIDPFINTGNGIITAMILRNEQKTRVHLSYEKFDQYILVYTL